MLNKQICSVALPPLQTGFQGRIKRKEKGPKTNINEESCVRLFSQTLVFSIEPLKRLFSPSYTFLSPSSPTPLLDFFSNYAFAPFCSNCDPARHARMQAEEAHKLKRPRMTWQKWFEIAQLSEEERLGQRGKGRCRRGKTIV